MATKTTKRPRSGIDELVKQLRAIDRRVQRLERRVAAATAAAVERDRELAESIKESAKQTAQLLCEAKRQRLRSDDFVGLVK